MRQIAVMALFCIMLSGLVLNLHAAHSDRKIPGSPHYSSILLSRAVPPKSFQVSINPDANISRVVVKLKEGTRTRLRQNRAVSLSGQSMGALNAILAQKSGLDIEPLITKAPDKIEKDKFIYEHKSGRQLADFNNYFTIAVSSTAEAEQLVNQLNRLDIVEIAYPEPVPEPAGDIAPTTPDFSANQEYLPVAPGGVDAEYAWTVAGGDGSGVTIIDIEGGWREDHEDLDAAMNGLIGGGEIQDLTWRNHGTAVLGIMFGGDNGYGVTGIAHGATAKMVGIGTISIADAIILAADSAQPGDIILIELHAAGPHYDFQNRLDQLGYVCMEYWQAEFDAIQYAWARGVIVCEAAGNGAENLDDVIYEDRFDTTYRNSHAIMIGAGAPPSGIYGIDRKRLSFSNYGERVNLQGHGEGVVTTGYGSLFNGGNDERQYYTAGFNGTSSASPVVTGAVASLQGIYRQRYSGASLDSDRMRDAIIATGSPQQYNTSQHIGPRPNIRGADSMLPPPYPLVIAPIYLDTSIQVETQATAYIDLYNISDSTLEYIAVPLADSLAKSGGWLLVPAPGGNIPPQGNLQLEITLDASAVIDRFEKYKSAVEIFFANDGGPLDDKLTFPVFLEVPCYDTSYAVSSTAAGDPLEFQWIDITGNGIRIQDYQWENPDYPQNQIDDGTAGPFYLGFDFPFFDSTYTHINIGANGGVSFTDEDMSISGYFTEITIPRAPFSSIVAPFWNDLNLDEVIDGHGDVYYYRSQHQDSFVVEYFQAGNYQSGSDTLTTFEIILTRNGNIKFQYLSVGDAGMADLATIGIAEYDCDARGYLNIGEPSSNIMGDSGVIFFDYNFTIYEQSGDVNRDGNVNVGDAVFLINWIFKSGATPQNMNEADANCDSWANVGDAVYIINYVFKSGPAPCDYIL